MGVCGLACLACSRVVGAVSPAPTIFNACSDLPLTHSLCHYLSVGKSEETYYHSTYTYILTVTEEILAVAVDV